MADRSPLALSTTTKLWPDNDEANTVISYAYCFRIVVHPPLLYVVRHLRAFIKHDSLPPSLFAAQRSISHSRRHCFVIDLEIHDTYNDPRNDNSGDRNHRWSPKVSSDFLDISVRLHHVVIP